jgi:hypothetical protein
MCKGLGHHAAASTNAQLPEIRSLSDWTKDPSTKYQVSVDIVKHLLSRDDAPKPQSDHKGNLILPPLHSISPGNLIPGQKRKGIIYAEFTSMVTFLKDVGRLELFDAYKSLISFAIRYSESMVSLP